MTRSRIVSSGGTPLFLLLAVLTLVPLCAATGTEVSSAAVAGGAEQAPPTASGPHAPPPKIVHPKLPPFAKAYIKNQRRSFPFPEGHECEEDAHKNCPGILHRCVGAFHCSMQCLTDHAPLLSPGCLRAHPCYDVIERHCADLPPGTNAVLDCLKEHRAEISPACFEQHPCLREGAPPCTPVDYEENARGAPDFVGNIANFLANIHLADPFERLFEGLEDAGERAAAADALPFHNSPLNLFPRHFGAPPSSSPATAVAAAAAGGAHRNRNNHGHHNNRHHNRRHHNNHNHHAARERQMLELERSLQRDRSQLLSERQELSGERRALQAERSQMERERRELHEHLQKLTASSGAMHSSMPGMARLGFADSLGAHNAPLASATKPSGISSTAILLGFVIFIVAVVLGVRHFANTPSPASRWIETAAPSSGL